MNNILKSVIFGVIEGITEWLPVSSTGHLIIAEHFLSFTNVSSGFYEAYSVIIQLGAVLSAAMIFFKRMFPVARQNGKIGINREILSFDFKIAVGCVPAAAAGLAFDEIIEKYFYSCVTVAAVLIIYGILFIIVERTKKLRFVTEYAEGIALKTALKVGLFQTLSLIPGTSRSGATVIGGMLCGMSRYSAAEFSFFMAIPIMAGASAVKAVDFGFSFTVNESAILMVGFITSFVVSVFVIDKLMGFVKKHTFTSFGIYRILLGMALLIFDF